MAVVPRFAPRRVGASLGIATLLGALAVAGDPSSALAQATETPEGAEPKPGPRDGQEFQDWRLRCEAPNELRPEFCEMRQRIVDQDGNRVVLAAVGRLPNIDKAGLLFILPLGISLPPGTFLKIDEGEEQRVPVERCEQQGCRIELILEGELLSRLKAGTRGTLSFYVYDGRGNRPRVDVPISLLGFSAALAEVMKIK
jgi:invasion protein IalB